MSGTLVPAHRQRRRRHLALVAALCFIACDAPTAADAPRVSLHLGSQFLGDTASARVSFHDVDSTVVSGEIRFPGLYFRAVASAEVVPDGVVLRLRAQPLPNCCADAVSYRAYRVRMTRVPFGAPTLRVIHEYPQSGWPPDTMLEYTIGLPPEVRRATP